ncbi:hypothetical protein ACFL6X_09230 [Candidatus Latescibacterota bacterium]
MLAQKAIATQLDLVYYPVCFLFRHCVELHLKALVSEIYCLHGVQVELEQDVKGLPAKPKGMMQKHGLLTLLRWIEEALRIFTDERVDQLVRETVTAMDRIDFDGQAFRYHSRRDGSPSLPGATYVQMGQLLQRMKSVHFHLLGIDLWLADHRATGQALLDELTP